MLKIRPEQMQALEVNYRNRRRKELWNKFKADYPVLRVGN